jgi:hypothetical protein
VDAGAPRGLEHAAEYVLKEVEFEAHRAARLEQFKIQLLRSSASKQKHEINSMFSSSYDHLKEKIGKIIERRGTGTHSGRIMERYNTENICNRASI